MDSGHHVAWFASSFAAVFVAMRCYVRGSFTLDGLHESRYWHDEERIVNNLGTLARSGTEAVIEARSTGVDICTIGQFRLCVILHIWFRHNPCRPQERWQRTGLAQGEVRRWFLSPCKKTRRCSFFRRFRTVSMTRCSLSLWCDAGVNFSTDRTVPARGNFGISTSSSGAGQLRQVAAKLATPGFGDCPPRRREFCLAVSCYGAGCGFSSSTGTGRSSRTSPWSLGSLSLSGRSRWKTWSQCALLVSGLYVLEIAPEYPVSSVSGTTHCCRVSFEGDDLIMATGQAVSHIHQRV